MVLECDMCVEYWLSHANSMEGFKYLISNQHIPKVHSTENGYSIHTQDLDSELPPQILINILPTNSDYTFTRSSELAAAGIITGGAGGAFHQYPYCLVCHDYAEYSEDNYDGELWVRGKHISDAHWRESVNKRDGPIADDQDQHGHGDPSHYFWAYRAASTGDWESYKSLCDRYADAKTARIGRKSETALMVAIGIGSKTAKFVEELLNTLTPSDLEMTDKDGRTALGIAAMVGNLEAAKLLVLKNPNLPNISSGCAAGFPIHCAAEYGDKNLLLYLLEVTKTRAYLNPFGRYGYGKKLISDVLKAEFYDVATKLMDNHVGEATWGVIKGLNLLAENPSAFSIGTGSEAYTPAKFFVENIPFLKQAEERRCNKYRNAVRLVAWSCRETLNGANADSVLKFKLPMLKFY